jgi:hypothetical protein
MKKISALLMAALVLLSLCACKANEIKGTEPPAASEPSTEPTKPIYTAADYVGTWKHEQTDKEPTTMIINLNDDGTGSMFKFQLNWSVNTDGSISITINYGTSKEPEKTDGILLEDGTLRWNKSYTVVDIDGAKHEIEYLNMKKV